MKRGLMKLGLSCQPLKGVIEEHLIEDKRRMIMPQMEYCKGTCDAGPGTDLVARRSPMSPLQRFCTDVQQ